MNSLHGNMCPEPSTGYCNPGKKAQISKKTTFDIEAQSFNIVHGYRNSFDRYREKLRYRYIPTSKFFTSISTFLRYCDESISLKNRSISKFLRCRYESMSIKKSSISIFLRGASISSILSSISSLISYLDIEGHFRTFDIESISSQYRNIQISYV